MLDVTDLAKSYGSVEALSGISFHVATGEIVGLLGPNGAGKTTAIKILTGYLQPDRGSVTVKGLDVLTHMRSVQSMIGYLPENAPLYPELTVQGYLQMMAELRQIPDDAQQLRLSEAIHAVGLSDQLTRPIGQLSKGYRQRVGLAQAILHRPELLILDEPSIGLDPTQIVEMRRLIRRLSKHSTVLFSTHILSEVEALCDRAIILMNGQIKADARLSELSATPDIVLVLDEAPREARQTLIRLSGVRAVEQHRTDDGKMAFRISARARGPDLRPDVYELARGKGWRLCELRRDVRTLEAVFNDLAVAV